MNHIQFLKDFGAVYTAKVVAHYPEFISVTRGDRSTAFYKDDVGSVQLQDLKGLLEQYYLIKRIGDLDKAQSIINGNLLGASYYCTQSKNYYRYGHNCVYVVRDGKYEEINGGLDSSTLIHTDWLKDAIKNMTICGVIK